MQALDQRLYAWLAEPDERRFERAFSDYFAVAFPALVRHLARLSAWDSVRAEDLAQEALLRFFDRVGRGRRAASGALASALTRLRPLNLGTFHASQARGWIEDVRTFTDTALRFRNEPGRAESHAAIRALVECIPLLQRRGRHLLEAVRLDLRWSIETQATTDMSVDEPSSISHGTPAPIVDEFVEQLVAESVTGSARAAAAAERHPGVKAFCEDVAVVIDSLPHLRVPTNSYLFQIARTIYLDECKKHGRQKRGGTGYRLADDVEVSHPLDSLDEASGCDEYGDDPSPAPATVSAAAFAPAVDPTLEYESEEFFAKFYEYLRGPLDRAAAAYQRASSTGRAASERRRLESVTGKFSRTIAVLSALGEGHTQERIGEKLGISRNQVKYIIELVQEAYAGFLRDPTKSAAASHNAGEQSHAS